MASRCEVCDDTNATIHCQVRARASAQPGWFVPGFPAPEETALLLRLGTLANPRGCTHRSAAARLARNATRSSISSMPTSRTTGILHRPQDKGEVLYCSPAGKLTLIGPPSRIPLYPSRGGSTVNSRPGSYAPTPARNVSPRGQRKPFQEQELVRVPPKLAQIQLVQIQELRWNRAARRLLREI